MDSQTPKTVENKKEQLILEEEEEEEEISDAFTCCICLDLLYKPIVLTCGHVSCFWCVHKSMNRQAVSHCPLCRQPYYHFPTICQLLYFLILKMYPNAYRRRENQILEQERAKDVFSPQIHVCTRQLQSNEDVGRTKTCNYSNFEQPESVLQNHGAAISRSTSEASAEPISTAFQVVLPSDKLDGNCKKASSDVFCSGCNQMLIHPVVLNCGHVYCEMCISKPANEVLRCNICQCPYPNGLPKVCLVLDQYLEEQYPEDYKQRKEAIQLKQVNICNETSSACSSSANASEQGSSWCYDFGSSVHVGVGCDFCGMFPIIGDRYRCKDCKEKIGFDLCSNCYNTRSKLPGRFNQQHKPEHKFALIGPRFYRMIMPRPVTEQRDENNARSNDGPTAYIVPENATGNSEYGQPGPTLSEDADNSEDSLDNSEYGLSSSTSSEYAENSENNLDYVDTAHDSYENQSDRSE